MPHLADGGALGASSCPAAGTTSAGHRDRPDDPVPDRRRGVPADRYDVPDGFVSQDRWACAPAVAGDGVQVAAHTVANRTLTSSSPSPSAGTPMVRSSTPLPVQIAARVRRGGIESIPAGVTGVEAIGSRIRRERRRGPWSCQCLSTASRKARVRDCDGAPSSWRGAPCSTMRPRSSGIAITLRWGLACDPHAALPRAGG